ncbi:MAG: oxidoreductase [Coriobacteriia bacterium]|nr:oxidoreductase [Coriobacteriia bacterium]
MSEYGMIIDYKYCTGCHTCEVACRKEKDIPLDEWGIKLFEVGPDELKGKWYWNFIPLPSDYCDLCHDRIKAGKKASCEFHCLANCIEIVRIEELSAKMIEYGNSVTCFIP